MVQFNRKKFQIVVKSFQKEKIMDTEVYLCTIERTIKKEWGTYGVLLKILT